MKKLPALAFVAALVAFVLFPLSFNVAASVLFLAWIPAIVLSDYGRTYRPLHASPTASPPVQRERLRLAA